VLSAFLGVGMAVLGSLYHLLSIAILAARFLSAFNPKHEDLKNLEAEWLRGL